MSLGGKIIDRLKLMVAKALLKSVNDTGDIQLVKFSGQAGEVMDNIERLQNYGMSSHPPVDSETLPIFMGGNRDSGVVIAIDSGANRPKNLLLGEVVFYSQHGQRIKMPLNGELHLMGSDTVPPADWSVRFSKLQVGFDELVEHYKAHIHVTTATVGASSTPGVISPTTPSTTASIDAAKINEFRVP